MARVSELGFYFVVRDARYLCFSGPQADSLNIAYVDLQKSLDFCEPSQEVKKQIALEVEKMKKSFVAKQKEVEKLKEDLEKRGMVLSEAVRMEKEMEYQFKLLDLQRMQRDYEEGLRQKGRGLSDSGIYTRTPFG